MRVLLVLPPVNVDGERCAFRHQPIVTAYLAGAAERAGAEVRIVDAAFEGKTPEVVGDIAEGFRPDLVAIVPYEYKRELPLTTTDAVARVVRARCPGVQIGVLNGIEEEQRVALVDRVANGTVDFAILGESSQWNLLCYFIECGLAQFGCHFRQHQTRDYEIGRNRLGRQLNRQRLNES